MRTASLALLLGILFQIPTLLTARTLALKPKPAASSREHAEPSPACPKGKSPVIGSVSCNYPIPNIPTYVGAVISLRSPPTKRAIRCEMSCSVAGLTPVAPSRQQCTIQPSEGPELSLQPILSTSCPPLAEVFYIVKYSLHDVAHVPTPLSGGLASSLCHYAIAKVPNPCANLQRSGIKKFDLSAGKRTGAPALLAGAAGDIEINEESLVYAAPPGSDGTPEVKASAVCCMSDAALPRPQ